MSERELLDCTLRDGGYVNDWNFGHQKIVEIFERLVSSGVEYIETGFLDERRKFDINRTIMPDTAALNEIFKGLDKGKATVLAMIDYGTCSIGNIQKCSETFIDGIRVIFKEHLMYEALDFCAQLKALGYKVFAQMVSVTTYSDEKLVEFAKEVNRIKPYATSMVDTYGLLDPEHLQHIFSILDRELDPEIKEGFHAHNNFQLGFANARSFLQSGTRRNILADGTLYGMGKSAGNAPLELLMNFCNAEFGKKYNIPQAMECIESCILPIYEKKYWGYNLFFYTSSLLKCHPNYVSYLTEKDTLSVSQITEVLGQLEGSKKLLFDKNYISGLYDSYQSVRCDDSGAYSELRKKIRGRKILLLGPGRSIEKNKKRILTYIKKEEPFVISLNYVPDFTDVDLLLVTNSKRYQEIANAVERSRSKPEIAATSNLTRIRGQFDCVFNYASLIDKDTQIKDNSFVMTLKILLKTDVKTLVTAGFDGFSNRTYNYFDVSKEYSFVRTNSKYFNSYVSGFLHDRRNSLKVFSLTKTKYSDVELVLQ